MNKKRRDPHRSALLAELIAELQPKSMLDLQEQLKELFAASMENMLKGELDGHLGYAKHSQESKPTNNRRNGSYDKTVRTNLGEVTLAIPRDREGDFEPELVPTGTKDVSGLEDKVLSMYAKGLSDRDISDTIDEIYGFKLSHETISRIVDRVQPRLNEWQSRSLKSVYAFLYVDALVVDVKSEGKAQNKAVYSIIGIDVDGKKDVLGFWISDKEGAHFWLSIFDELKSRGVKKVHFVSIDGLKGLEESVKNAFEQAIVQRCMVHLVRNSIKYVPTKYYKAFCVDLKAMYGAVSLVASEAGLARLTEKWGENYPSAVKVWTENFRFVAQLFDYPTQVRKMIYTTNMIETFNSALRKVTNRKAAFPNDNSVFKILFLRTMDIAKKWTKPIANWALIRGKLDIVLEKGWDC